jgi:hypothetical protein
MVVILIDEAVIEADRSGCPRVAESLLIQKVELAMIRIKMVAYLYCKHEYPSREGDMGPTLCYS